MPALSGYSAIFVVLLLRTWSSHTHTVPSLLAVMMLPGALLHEQQATRSKTVTVGASQHCFQAALVCQRPNAKQHQDTSVLHTCCPSTCP